MTTDHELLLEIGVEVEQRGPGVDLAIVADVLLQRHFDGLVGRPDHLANAQRVVRGHLLELVKRHFDRAAERAAARRLVAKPGRRRNA